MVRSDEMEEWKTVFIDGEQYDYEVSTHGNIRRTKTGRIIKKQVNKNGYVYVNLSHNGIVKKFKVHRLVAIMFIENNDETKTQVNHIDENKQNNHITNLEWTTPKQNSNHGTRTKRIVEKTSKKILCVETGRIFNSISEASRILEIDVSNIEKCLKGKRKTCGGYHWEYI